MSATIATAASTSTAAASPAAATSTAAAQAWDIDSGHSSAGFKVRHLMLSHVRGELGAVSGTLWLDDRQIERSRVEVSIDARQIATRDDKRDEHLRSADFLDVANHPTVTFHSTKVESAAGGELRVIGDLTIRGAARSVTLEVDPLPPAVADPWGNTRRGATARTKINRKEWGLHWNVGLEAGGLVVGEDVTVEIEVELVQRKA
jgi:polyisoprenoid-binding protein YceI